MAKVIFDFGDEVLGPQITIENARVEENNANGSQSVKYVNAEDLQSIFQNTTMDTGYLPRVRVLKYLKVSGGDEIVKMDDVIEWTTFFLVKNVSFSIAVIFRLYCVWTYGIDVFSTVSNAYFLYSQFYIV